MSLVSLVIKFSPFLSHSFGVNGWQSCLLRTFSPKWVLLAISQSESRRGLAAVIVSCPVIHCPWSGSRICLWIASSLNSLSPCCFGSDTVAHILTRDLCTVQYRWKKKAHEVCFKSIVKAWTNTIHRSLYICTLSLTHSHKCTHRGSGCDWSRMTPEQTAGGWFGMLIGCWNRAVHGLF